MPVDLGCLELCCEACLSIALALPPPLDVLAAASCAIGCRIACDTDTINADNTTGVPYSGGGANGGCNDISNPLSIPEPEVPYCTF